jgi:signal peptidase
MSKGRLRDKAKPDKKAKDEEEEELEEEEEEKFNLKKSALAWAKDILIAFGIIIALILVLFIYTGNWPPLVVVESNSMMHEDGVSHLGVIDTGDMVLVKEIDVEYRSETKVFQGRDYKVNTGLKEITTWTEKRDKHYGNWGDVIIFKKEGVEDATPVIHRAIVWLEVNYTYYNDTTNDGATFDIPSMDLYGESSVIYITDYPAFGRNGDELIDLEIDLNALLDRAKLDGQKPLSGYITKGDWNHNMVDQFSLPSGSGDGRSIDLVLPQWIIGKARFELPWFGLIKLWITGKITSKNPAPDYSWRYLFLTLAIVLASVIAIDFTIAFVSKRLKKDKDKKKEDEKVKDGEGKLSRRRGGRPDRGRSTKRESPRHKSGELRKGPKGRKRS